MTDAELVAYMAGANIAAEVIHAVERNVDVDLLPDEPLTEELISARDRLGEDRFAYWIMRGSRDAVAAL
jgi:hypothetical protein